MIYLGQNPVGLTQVISQIGSNARIETGVYIPSTDETTGIQVEHSLGTVPDFIIYFSENFTSDLTRDYACTGAIIKTNEQIYDTQDYCSVSFTRFSTAKTLKITTGSGTMGLFASNSYFTLRCLASAYFKQNVKYYYIVGTFNDSLEVTPNA